MRTVVRNARLFDSAAGVLRPGLIDAHVHVTAAAHDFFALALQPASLTGAQSSHILRDMLRRGFTTCATRPAPTSVCRKRCPAASTMARAC